MGRHYQQQPQPMYYQQPQQQPVYIQQAPRRDNDRGCLGTCCRFLCCLCLIDLCCDCLC
ncbi:cysteine-rich palmitoylated domain-containing protein CPP3 NDAI_0A05740 [Naumovozyma dairenensis CBS 421]|uniref:Uncharacterized protein n=1 Tax=Naumovozyma dairenensis (strain ATCC 10597 / BCRC 20456 / CBS 421 / NBRC 0211 / NRRL Y-12639) TaxID=1071378 RepID=G0W4J1_NAUDC|nr:hypothetical protein NDAI_0A05740 [Naumovozyma dairenensis CBS 421]CCD22729.1 hypothetical protein NDAI_0A05740 [Naumovozyma dairenensis CBS 421]